MQELVVMQTADIGWRSYTYNRHRQISNSSSLRESAK